VTVIVGVTVIVIDGVTLGDTLGIIKLIWLRQFTVDLTLIVVAKSGTNDDI
jgi:hypothetical protein